MRRNDIPTLRLLKYPQNMSFLFRNVKYELETTNFGTKCGNIVRMEAKAVAFQVRRSASRMQLVDCATFRNSCGHFEHAGLARNVNRKYSVSPDFNYEARMEIARESGAERKRKREMKEGVEERLERARRKKERNKSLPGLSLELRRVKIVPLVRRKRRVYNEEGVERDDAISHCVREMRWSTKRRTRKNSEHFKENTLCMEKERKRKKGKERKR